VPKADYVITDIINVQSIYGPCSQLIETSLALLIVVELNRCTQYGNVVSMYMHTNMFIPHEPTCTHVVTATSSKEISDTGNF